MIVTPYDYHRTSSQGWGRSLPLWVGAGAVVVTALIGTLAGLYPSARAGRESPSRR